MAAVIKADEERCVEVWPENWQAIDIFCSLATQWNAGMGGATGLKYEVMFQLLDRRGYEGDEWQAMFDDIRVLERTALDAMKTKAS